MSRDRVEAGCGYGWTVTTAPHNTPPAGGARARGKSRTGPADDHATTSTGHGTGRSSTRARQSRGRPTSRSEADDARDPLALGSLAPSQDYLKIGDLA